jgi:hypothetical protein
MSARAHAERFLAACPADVRSEALLLWSEMPDTVQSVLWGKRGDDSRCQIIFLKNRLVVYVEGIFRGRTTIDKLLGEVSGHVG